MVIDKIGNINNIPEPKKSGKLSGSKESSRNDSILISTEGKQAAETSRFAALVKSSPDTRADIVKDIKSRIADGSYDFNSDSVLEKVADRIATSLLKK